MSELNPNHPVTQAVHDHWHKIVALLMVKLHISHVVITDLDIVEMQESGVAAVTIRELSDGIHLTLVDDAEADRLTRREGGLPT